MVSDEMYDDCIDDKEFLCKVSKAFLKSLTEKYTERDDIEAIVGVVDILKAQIEERCD
jgi:hypothetical protein